MSSKDEGEVNQSGFLFKHQLSLGVDAIVEIASYNISFNGEKVNNFFKLFEIYFLSIHIVTLSMFHLLN